MKKQPASFFSGLFGAKGKTPAAQTSQVTVTAASQPHVLRQRMQENALTHGQTVTANIAPVRLERIPGNDAVLYFCPVKTIEVLTQINNGDGGALPADVSVEGLTVPTEADAGLYKLCHVSLTSNGRMQVGATPETRWERIH